MPLTIDDFEYPKELRPGMLDRKVRHPYEQETFMFLLLRYAVDKKDLYAVYHAEFHHESLVKDGFIEVVAPQKYKLTKMGAALLYMYYHKKA